MPERADGVAKLILVPALITLAVTLARLAGELTGGPDSLFSREAGGKAALVGIVWLIPVFGVYFALRLARAGQGPPSVGKALGFAFTSWIALAVARPGWPALWRVLLAYALAARIPVLIVMFLSIFGGWDTHYAKPRPDFPPTGPWGLFFWTAMLPQLSVWIWMTIAMGMMFGALAVALRGRAGAPLPAP